MQITQVRRELRQAVNAIRRLDREYAPLDRQTRLAMPLVETPDWLRARNRGHAAALAAANAELLRAVIAADEAGVPAGAIRAALGDLGERFRISRGVSYGVA